MSLITILLPDALTNFSPSTHISLYMKIYIPWPVCVCVYVCVCVFCVCMHFYVPVCIVGLINFEDKNFKDFMDAY